MEERIEILEKKIGLLLELIDGVEKRIDLTNGRIDTVKGITDLLHEGYRNNVTMIKTNNDSITAIFDILTDKES